MYRVNISSIILQRYETDDKVLDVLLHLPRHFFMVSAFEKIAYEDRAFPIAEGQTISQPYTVAYQTQLLDVKPREKILEVGTGSAYQASVLAELGAQVFTIERQKKLFETNKLFTYLKKYPGMRFFYGDGYEGLPTYAPFDKVLVTAAAPSVPVKLIAQLKTGGKIVIPVGEGKVQRMLRITKGEGATLEEEVFDNFSFVPMVEGKKN